MAASVKNSNLITHVYDLVTLQQELDRYRFVVLDISGTFCGPCKLIAPRIRELARRETAVRFLECDEHAEELMQRFNITAFPTFLYFVDGMWVASDVGADIHKVTQRVTNLVLMAPVVV